jgi:hypothetical protein
VQQGRLAGSDLAREHDEALARLDAVDQRGEALAVGLTQVEKRRVRRHLEGAVQQAVEFPVHA